MEVQTGDKSKKGDTSTKCSKVDDEAESQMVFDYTSEFTTYEIFKSREALCNWAREVGKRNGFVIVISKSDVSSKGRSTARLTLGCERGGHYIIRKGDNISQLEEVEKKRKTGTKKCGCPFTLKGLKMPTDDEWMLTVVNGMHNHLNVEYLEGHSYAGRLSGEENALVVDMSKRMARPRDILATLKQKNVLNASTMRTIYNARRLNRVKEKAGRSQMQCLLGKLVENNYIQWHRNTEGTETVTDLLWAHPHSLDLLYAFPCVLIMDCTCKTNRYRLPLLEIVGVTSTDLTFSVAFAYLMSEREDNYTWALSILRSIMDDRNVTPNVIVTDRELSLLNAIEKVFPTSRHMLCRWHISKDILANCKDMFLKRHREKFMSMWNLVVLSDTKEEYNLNLSLLMTDFKNYPEALQYVSNSWLTPYKSRFVSAWTNQFMHYGNKTTNRAKSAHAKLNRQLGCSTLNFETSWPQIHSLIELQHTEIKASFEKSLTVVQSNFKGTELRELRGIISISALQNILDQHKIANSVGIDASACGCANRRTHGLPCAHEIAEYMREGQPIPIDCIDPHWRKLDMLPSPNQDMPQLSFQTEIDLFAKRFLENDKHSQMEMLKKLREIACPESTHVQKPDVSNVRPQGRPKIKIDASTRCDPSAFEDTLSTQDSHSPLSSISNPLKKMKPNIKQVHITHSSCSVPYVIEFPMPLREYIYRTVDVEADGNCGFRVIAALLDFGEDEWKRVRDDLMIELQTYSKLYERVYGSEERVVELSKSIGCFEEYPGSEFWMTMPDMGHIIASRYNVVLYHLSNIHCITFLPLHTPPVLPTKRKEVVIGFVSSCHFIQIFMRAGHPVPPIAGSWTKHHVKPMADGWDVAYKDRIQQFKELVGSNIVTSKTINID